MISVHRGFSALMIAALVFPSVCTGAAGSIEPSWTSAEDNIAFAVSAICLPFVLDGMSPARLPMEREPVHRDGWTDFSFQRLAIEPVRVGFAGHVHVGVVAKPDLRHCEVDAVGADPELMRQAVLRVLDTRPEAFAPTKSRYLHPRFATEDMLCASAGSPHPGAQVLLSAAYPQNSGQLAIALSIWDAPRRQPECDNDGVHMNYRTLITP